MYVETHIQRVSEDPEAFVHEESVAREYIRARTSEPAPESAEPAPLSMESPRGSGLGGHPMVRPKDRAPCIPPALGHCRKTPLGCRGP